MRFVMALVVVILLLSILYLYPYEDGITDHRSLAYKDSKFINIDGLEVHYRRYGFGERYIVLLHGFGSSTYTWNKIIKSLSPKFTIISFDRPGFGLTQRRFDLNYNPYTVEYHLKLIEKLMKLMRINRAILVGHSAGGTLAVLFTLNHPEMVEELVLIDPAIFTTSGIPEWFRIISSIPFIDHIGPKLVGWILLNSPEKILRNAYYNPNKLTEVDIEEYKKSTKIFGWKRALWEFTKGSRVESFEFRLPEINQRTIIIHGRQDKMIPLEGSIRLNKILSNSSLFIVENCGHLPQEECPDEVAKILLNNL